MAKSNLPSMYELCLNHARADRAMRVIVAEQLAKNQLSIMEWLALGVITNAPKQGISMTQIASDLDVTLPQVTALVSALMKLRFVKQKIHIKDRRGRQVVVTIRGKRTLMKLESDVSKAMTAWTSDIKPQNLKNYISTVSKLAGNNS